MNQNSNQEAEEASVSESRLFSIDIKSLENKDCGTTDCLHPPPAVDVTYTEKGDAEPFVQKFLKLQEMMERTTPLSIEELLNNYSSPN